MNRRGRPRSLDDEVIAKLLAFGIKPGVVALAFRVHPKTVERARRRYDEEALPTIQRLTQALEQAAGKQCHCDEECDGTLCAKCVARAALSL